MGSRSDCIFNSMSATIGLLLTFMFAICTGFTTFFVSYCIGPSIKLMYIIMRVTASMNRVVVRLFCDPVYESAGRMLSGINVRLHVNQPISVRNV